MLANASCHAVEKCLSLRLHLRIANRTQGNRYVNQLLVRSALLTPQATKATTSGSRGDSKRRSRSRSRSCSHGRSSRRRKRSSRSRSPKRHRSRRRSSRSRSPRRHRSGRHTSGSPRGERSRLGPRPSFAPPLGEGFPPLGEGFPPHQQRQQQQGPWRQPPPPPRANRPPPQRQQELERTPKGQEQRASGAHPQAVSGLACIAVNKLCFQHGQSLAVQSSCSHQWAAWLKPSVVRPHLPTRAATATRCIRRRRGLRCREGLPQCPSGLRPRHAGSTTALTPPPQPRAWRFRKRQPQQRRRPATSSGMAQRPRLRRST